MIEIKPDPQRPRGGYAQILVEGVAGAENAAEVAVYDSYQQKWLGPDGWQPGRATLPARQTSLEGTTLRVIVGPDVVNQIEENTPVRIEVAGGSWDTYWPEDINHGPEIALEGDLGGTGARPAPAEPRAAKMPEAPVPTPEPDVSDATDDDDADMAEADATAAMAGADADAPPRKSALVPILLVVLLLLAAAGGGAWYYLNSQDDAPPVVAALPEPVVTQQPRPTGPACAIEDFASLAGFSAVLDKMRGCVGDMSPDAALSLVERAAGAGDAEALSLFGALYDGEVTEDGLETEMGLTFTDDPARAAGYYARAALAGAQDGQSRLDGVCTRLSTATDTLSAGAFQDYCQ